MSDLVERYRSNYGIPEEEPLTEEQVRHHLRFERELTEELLTSSPEDRWEAFERCYGRLYRELPWLHAADSARELGDWPTLIGPPPRRVYEVGSGQGGLAGALAAHGYDVVATEVTRERGGERAEWPGLSWAHTDGVHLDRFAPRAAFDAVVSNQVVEHLHPDDLVAHFEGAHALLRPGGRYVLETPHALEGPADISAVFGEERPIGMHLREYTYGELARVARRAGFARVAAPLGLPARVRARLALSVRPSGPYLAYLRGLEAALGRIPGQRRRRAATRALKVPLFTRGLTLVAFRD